MTTRDRLAERRSALEVMRAELADAASSAPPDRLPALAAVLDRVTAHLRGVEEAEAADALLDADPVLVGTAATVVALEAMTADERADVSAVNALVAERLGDAGWLPEQFAPGSLRIRPHADRWAVHAADGAHLADVPRVLLPERWR